MHSQQLPSAVGPKSIAQREAELARLRREDAVDVLAEALWELWVRQYAQSGRQAPTWRAEKHTHG